MIEACLSFLFLVIFVEAFTEILVESSILTKPREFLARCNGLLGELVHCGYCTSVWVSAAVAWIVPMFIWTIVPNFWISYIIALFVLHRLSNLLHELNSKWLNRRPINFAVHKTETVLMPDIGNEYDPKE
jgi:hypothetical protein